MRISATKNGNPPEMRPCTVRVRISFVNILETSPRIDSRRLVVE